MKTFFYILSVLFMNAPQTGGYCPAGFTDAEKEIIGNIADGTMRLYTTDNEQDSILLRTESSDIPAECVDTETFRTLTARMFATVTDTANSGVGIAAPQVGILRRVILVQRFDIEGEPFGVYINPRILEYSEDSQVGGEGCLSIPGHSGSVMRAAEIRISYLDPQTLRETEETVSGFTAVIFQHEIDHLDGILFTDREEENQISTISYTPQGVCSKSINIVAENGYITAIDVEGGCSGNSQGIMRLLAGMTVGDAIERLEGISCKDKTTSCPDQIAQALRQLQIEE